MRLRHGWNRIDKQHIQDIVSHPAPETDRVGQQVQICEQPRMVYEVTGWNAELGLWAAKCAEPSPKMVGMTFTEGFLALMSEREGS